MSQRKLKDADVPIEYELAFNAILNEVALPFWNVSFDGRASRQLSTKDIRLHFGMVESFMVTSDKPFRLVHALIRGTEQIMGLDKTHLWVNPAIDSIQTATIALLDGMLQHFEEGTHGNSKKAVKVRENVFEKYFKVDYSALEIPNEDLYSAVQDHLEEYGQMPKGISAKAATSSGPRQGQARIKIACPNVVASDDEGKAKGCGVADADSNGRWVPVAYPVTRALLDLALTGPYPATCYQCGQALVLVDADALRKAKASTVKKSAKPKARKVKATSKKDLNA